MWAALAGLATAVGGSIFSGVKSAQANRKKKKYLKLMEKEAGDRLSDSLGDGTQTAAQQLADTNMRRLALKQLEQTDATGVVSGGTGVGRAQALEAINEGIAQNAGNAAVQQQQRIDNARAQYEATKQQINNQKMQMQSDLAQQNAQAGAQVAQAGLNLAVSDISSSLDNKAKSPRLRLGDGSLKGLGASVEDSQAELAGLQKMKIGGNTTVTDAYNKRIL